MREERTCNENLHAKDSPAITTRRDRTGRIARSVGRWATLGLLAVAVFWLLHRLTDSRGERIWQTPAPDGEHYDHLIPGSTFLLARTNAGTLMAFDRLSGKVLWEGEVDDHVISHVEGNRFLLWSRRGGRLIDASTGEDILRLPLDAERIALHFDCSAHMIAVVHVKRRALKADEIDSLHSNQPDPDLLRSLHYGAVRDRPDVITERRLCAYGPETDEPLWALPLPSTAVTGPPIICRPAVVLPRIVRDGIQPPKAELVAYAMSDGEMLWRRELTDEVRQRLQAMRRPKLIGAAYRLAVSPVSTNGTQIFVSGDSGTRCIEPAGGELLWRNGLRSLWELRAKRIYGNDAQGFCCVDARNGKPLWHMPSDLWPILGSTSDAAFADRFALATHDPRKTRAVRQQDVEQDGCQDPLQGFVIGDERGSARLVQDEDQQHLVAIDLRTGQALWRKARAGQLLATHGQQAVLMEQAGSEQAATLLSAIDLSTGETRWEHAYDGTLMQGTLDEHAFYCIAQPNDSTETASCIYAISIQH